MAIFQLAVIALIFNKIAPLKFSFSLLSVYNVLFSCSPLPGDYSNFVKRKLKRVFIFKRYFSHAHLYLLKFKLIFIHSHQKVEATQASSHRCLDEQIWPIHTRRCSSAMDRNAVWHRLQHGWASGTLCYLKQTRHGRMTVIWCQLHSVSRRGNHRDKR